MISEDVACARRRVTNGQYYTIDTLFSAFSVRAWEQTE